MPSGELNTMVVTPDFRSLEMDPGQRYLFAPPPEWKIDNLRVFFPATICFCFLSENLKSMIRGMSNP